MDNSITYVLKYKLYSCCAYGLYAIHIYYCNTHQIPSNKCSLCQASVLANLFCRYSWTPTQDTCVHTCRHRCLMRALVGSRWNADLDNKTTKAPVGTVRWGTYIYPFRCKRADKDSRSTQIRTYQVFSLGIKTFPWAHA